MQLIHFIYIVHAFCSCSLLTVTLAALLLLSRAAGSPDAAGVVEELVVEVLRAVPEPVHVRHARDADHVLVLGAVLLDAVAERLDLVAALLLELLQAEDPVCQLRVVRGSQRKVEDGAEAQREEQD